MQFIYPAVFSKREDFMVTTAIFRTSTSATRRRHSDEVLYNAIEEARSWIQVELEDTFELPPVTHPEDIVLKEGERLSGPLLSSSA